MTFDEWVASKDFYKGDTGESFRVVWEALAEIWVSTKDVAGALDEMVGAIRHEYGD